VLMYSGCHNSPGTASPYIYVYFICDLKLCVNCVELEAGAAKAGIFSSGECDGGICNTGGENRLVISVDQRHGAGVDGYSVCYFYTSPAKWVPI
jgi:hypothetical protein